MRTHTNGYKTSIKGIRKINTILTNVDTSTIISNDNLVKVKPILNADLLKSTMKQLDIESKIDISLNTIVNFQQGVLVNDNYEYMNYGNYVVYESEYQADTKTYKIVCYDKMLYSMVDYEAMEITYPITIRNYIKAIATKLGLDFANENDEFVNYNKEIPNELYLDSLGRSLGYTFRDVLDELSQVTASCICINSNDKIEVRYINENLTEISNKVGSNITETTIKAPIQLNNILGDMEQNGTPSPSTPIEIDTVTGLQKIQICEKNLLNIPNGTYSNNSVTAVVENGKITLNGTASATSFITIPFNFKFAINEDYILSINNSTGIGNNTYWAGCKFTYNGVSTNPATFTNANTTKIYNINVENKVTEFVIRTNSGIAYDNYVIYPQLEKGNQAKTFEEYKGKEYQINLGKNILDATQQSYTLPANTNTYQTIHNTKTYLKANTKYYISYNIDNDSTSNTRSTPRLYLNQQYIESSNTNRNTTKGRKVWKFTPTISGYYELQYWLHTSDVDVTVSDFMISTSSDIEYKSYFEPIELCKIGDYQDKIYKSNGKWYIEKQIGKVILNGSEQGWNVFFSTNGIYVLANYIQSKTSGTDIQCKSNYFDATTRNNIRNNLGTVDNACATNGGEIILANKSISSLNDFKTWLGNHNTTLYTILATPETTEITNTELINQLNDLYNAKSNNGTTNIVVYGGAILDVNLGKSRETINEDYLKNINVTFGEKYGPVNSIVLSRSAGSDNIYKKDDESIEENGLCELKISDNQIMNFNDRDAYLNEIFDRLNGLEYFINDFDSPGITYLELLDKYDIQIENDTYTCILLNDEIEINKGISERIFTDTLEDSKTDYTKSDKTDRKINQAYIIVDKQNQTITALTSRTNDIENTETNHYNELINEFSNYAPLTSVDTLTTQVNQIQTDTYTKTQIQEIANGTGVDGVTVTAIISTEAQFDKDGMHYSKTDAPTNSTIDYKGFEVDDKNGKEIFYAGYDENDQSPTYGTSIVRTDNINVDTYLQFGNNKGRFEEFEDADGNVGIGLFLM